ncbi:MAG: PD-(D/E)XK nuclease family protein [Legionellales bacterium]
MQYINDKSMLLDLMAQGATLFTPNNRLSGALLHQYFKHRGTTNLDKPSCLPYNNALLQSYQKLKFQTPKQDHPIVLSDSQCQHLWRTIIKSQPSITYSEGLLNALLEAWEHCQYWHIDPENQDFHYTPQTAQFQKWWNKASDHLQKKGLITEYQLANYLIDANKPLFTEAVVWVCFDSFNPQQMRLQDHLKNQGIAQYHYDLKDHEALPQLYAAADHNEEYQQLCLWLKLKLQQGDKRIGVVIPDLQDQSLSIQRLLLSHFDPADFDISLGQHLGEFPVIAHALSWLNLEQTHIPQHQATLLLQSPYIGHAKEEFIARSQYLQDSTLLKDPILSFNRLILDTAVPTPKLSELLASIKPFPKKACVQEWVSLFQERLNAIGFPGDYGLNSLNYQCVNRFTAVFDELRKLSILTPILSAQEALYAFTQLMNNSIFQPQKAPAPIQISGLLEASGCEFDSLWVMGLTDNCLPQKARLSAFIPPQLQRSLHMPHSTPAKELLFAEQTLERLQKGSLSTVFSYPKLLEDTPNLPCSLITGFPDYEPLLIKAAALKETCLIASEESYSLPIRPEEHISGGTSILANQAKCPFKAFAEHRLKAKPLPKITEDLDALEKGQIVHKVMELLWKTLKSQQELLHLSPEVLDKHIDNAIKTALSPFEKLHPDSFPSLIQEVEYTRLKRLVASCLEWERQRPPFEIAAVEESYSIPIAGLDFKVRVDRLDQVGDKKWVIDYKSCLPASKPWNEDRPKEPQLLLYALLDEQINALVLLQLKSGTTACSGFSEEKYSIAGMSSLKKGEHWDVRRTHWQDQLNLLAEEFQQGHCPPQPANPSICQHCDFQNLCRFQQF